MAVTCSLCVTRDPVSTLSSGSYNEEDHLGPVTLGGGAGPPWGMGNQVPTQFWLMPKPLFAFQNMPNVRDHDASVYLRLQGDALSVGGYEANPIFWEEVRCQGPGIMGGSQGCISALRGLLSGGPPS